MKSSFCIDLQRFMLIPTKFPLSHESLSFTKLLYCKFIPLLNFRKAHNKQIFRLLSSQTNIAVLNVVAAFGDACLRYFPCFKCESSEK